MQTDDGSPVLQPQTAVAQSARRAQNLDLRADVVASSVARDMRKVQSMGDFVSMQSRKKEQKKLSNKLVVEKLRVFCASYVSCLSRCVRVQEMQFEVSALNRKIREYEEENEQWSLRSARSVLWSCLTSFVLVCS